MAKINLRESLNKIDLATDNKYDLLNTFDSKKLSDNSKKKLAEAIDNNSIASINRVLHESSEQLYKVVISSGATKRNFESALYEDEAEGIVDYYGGRWIDENGFEWDMYVEEDDDSTERVYPFDESLNEQKYSSGNYFLTVEETGMGPHYSLYYQHPHSGYDGLMFIVDGYGYDNFKEKLSKFSTVYPNKDVQNLLKNINESKSVSTIGKALLPKKESLKEASYGGAYDIEDDMYFTKEEIVEFADNICEDLAKEFGYKYDIADVYMDSPTKLHIELIDNHDVEVDINVRIDMRRIKKPSDLEKIYHNSTLESFKNRFLEEYQYYEFDESLKESIDISDYEELHYPLRDGDKYYQLYRKIENGKGVWAAAELDKYSSDIVGEPFKITYEQARGFEPIEDSSIRKLSRDLGKKLLPKRENLDEQINLPGYAVKYVTGYAGNGVNSSETEWFRTKEERDRRAKELKDKNYTEIKTWKMDNFYHTLPKNESLKEYYKPFYKTFNEFVSEVYGLKAEELDELDDDTLDKYYYEYREYIRNKTYSPHNKSLPSRYWEPGWEDANDIPSDEKHPFESLKEDFDDEYESDFDDNEVEEGNHVFADGEEYVWVERIAGPIYLDFDKWAVWSARVFVDPREFMTIHDNGKGYDFDGDAFKEKAMAAPIVYFVVEEDTGFIDWGPVESRIEAQDFLNGKQEDWENDEYYGESLEKNLDEWYVHTIHYEDIGDGREYDYEVDHEEVLDYLSEIAIDEEDAPEDTEEYLKWVEDNFDELFNKYEYEIEEHFREDASQEEYDRRHSSYES